MTIILIIIIFFIIRKFYNNKIKKEAIESSRIFFKYDDRIHNEPEQQKRIHRAVVENLKVNRIIEDNFCASIVCASKQFYKTSLVKCSCCDFKKQHKPCKHMYKLATEINRVKIQKKNNQYLLNRCIDNNTKTDSIEMQTLNLELGSAKINVSQTESVETSFHDNMNYMIFAGDGLFLETGRRRKVRVEAFSEEEALSELTASGYDKESLNISRIPFEPPTERQLNVMQEHGDEVPKNACKKDISFLIEKIINDEHNADLALLRFATEHKVKISYFIGDESLHKYIMCYLCKTEKVAFYLLCVYKDKTGCWNFNCWESYKEIAGSLVQNSKFMNSFKRLLNSEFYGFNDYRASRSANCYKEAVCSLELN